MGTPNFEDAQFHNTFGNSMLNTSQALQNFDFWRNWIQIQRKEKLLYFQQQKIYTQKGRRFVRKKCICKRRN